MFKPRPAGFIWLFAHELRLLWRGSILLRTSRHVMVPLVAVGLVFQGAAVGIAWAAHGQHLGAGILVMIANLNLIFLLFLMLSRAMTSAIDVLYARGDVDFLLASPLAPSRVLAVRMAGVAGATAAPWLLLGGALANGLVVFGHARALVIYPVIAGLAAAAAAAAFAIVVVLVGQAGARVARGIAQSLALSIGVGIFALGQMPRFVSKTAMGRFWRQFEPSAADAHWWLWVPGRALVGEPAPLVATLASMALVFLAVLFGLAPRFAAGAIAAAATPTSATRPKNHRFNRHPLAAALSKNLRLLRRFPGLIPQTVYRSLTLVPVVVILSGKTMSGVSLAVTVPLMVFLAGQLALFFASALIAGEQAPDLLAAAPVQPGLAARAAAAAALIATMAVLAPPLLGLAARSPALLAAALPLTVAAGLCNIASAQRHPIALTRAGFGKSQKGTVFGLILGVSISTAWALAAYLIVTPHPFAFIR